MKKQPLAKKLHKPVHPMTGKVVLGAGILLAAGALALLFQQQSMKSSATITPPTQALYNSPTTVPTLPPEYGVHTFTSTSLSISFMYNAGDPQYQKEPYK